MRGPSRFDEISLRVTLTVAQSPGNRENWVVRASAGVLHTSRAVEHEALLLVVRDLVVLVVVVVVLVWIAYEMRRGRKP